jgi:hypothetical protein
MTIDRVGSMSRIADQPMLQTQSRWPWLHSSVEQDRAAEDS